MAIPGRQTAIRLATAALCAAVSYPASADIEGQRALFVAVYEAAERGDWSPVEQLPDAQRQQLAAYPLWPDLRAAWLEARIRESGREEVEAFLDEYGTLKPARELRYHWALELVRRDELGAYQDLYNTWYRELGLPKLDCLNLQAELAAGRGGSIAEHGRTLWMTGKSQADECDPVFEAMQSRGQLTRDDYRKRFELAIEEREFRRARWLGKSIDDAHVALAERWLQAQTNPADFLAAHATHDDSELLREQLAYAAERLTFRDPVEARRLWAGALQRHRFGDPVKDDVARHIALWMARDNLPGAYDDLAALPESASDDEVWRWRARTSLRSGEWSHMAEAIEGLSEEERAREEWRYWKAIAQRHSGDTEAAALALAELATERSYYGFLAADATGQPYAYGSVALAADEQVIDELASQAPFIRARELFLVGLDSRGRSEWDALVTGLSAEEKQQAALLADRWGWHSRAIAAVALVGEYDDLALRYPLPFEDRFMTAATNARIEPTWAYGIARSESLFMRDVRSGAGAVGLMQLLPTTGRELARQLDEPWSGLDTLTDPEQNIVLGTAYLSRMAERFGGNQVLATAAYNAGPRRVDEWIPPETSMDARIWIETIPFNETRGYVRRVLEADVIFYWRLTGETRRVSETLVAVKPQADVQRVASSSR